MAVVIYKSINKTVATIADRNAISPKLDHMVVTVLDAIADPNAGTGVATYRWNESLSNWVLISKSTYDTMSFDTEELTISSGSVTASNIPTDGQIWDVKVVDGDVIIADIRDDDLSISGATISGLETYNGYKLRFTYAYGSVASQVTAYVDAAIANVNSSGIELDATQTGAGLNSDGSYSANGSANYISSATSLADADDKLDAQIKTNADAIANMSTSAITQGDTSVEVTDTGSDGSIAMTTDGTERWNVTTDGHLIPGANSTYDIGSADKKVRHFYLSSNSLKFIDDSNNEYPLSVSEGVLLFNGEAVGSGSGGGDVTQAELDEVASYLPTDTVTTNIGNSVYFDGSSDYLSAPNGSANDLGTGDFTIECWFKSDTGAINNTHAALVSSYGGSTNGSWSIKAQNGTNGKVGFAWFDGTWRGFDTSVNVASDQQWHHIAVTRSGSSVVIWIDGVNVASSSVTSNLSGGGHELVVGYMAQDAGSYINGYISNVRIIKGVAVYTSSFTAPTEPLSVTAETEFLTANDTVIDDDSSNGVSITANGDAAVSNDSPFSSTSTGYVAAIGDIGTAGDILYHDGTSFVRLPIGSVGQVLKVGASGLPEWV